MKQDKVIELALKANCYELPSDLDDGDWISSPEQLARFASLVEQATLERAAQECEQSEAYRGSVFAQRIRALKPSQED